MIKKEWQKTTNHFTTPAGVVDLLPSAPSKSPFSKRVKNLFLSSTLEEKILSQDMKLVNSSSKGVPFTLNSHNEKELATKVLLLRHRFTEKIYRTREFRQATLTIIQNIYLFKNRKIFFGTCSESFSIEREEALMLFSNYPGKRTLPFAKTLQHLIIARVWNRIISLSTEQDQKRKDFIEVCEIVEKLNTIRNIYMLLSTGLVKKLAGRINKIYKESIAYEDAVQIGSFGVARAAYRYHQSSGVRFSTYAANWIFKEIQTQALKGRLIRISAHTVEGYTKGAKEANNETVDHFKKLIKNATTTQIREDCYTHSYPQQSQTALPENIMEARQRQKLLCQAVDQVLPGMSGDIIKRRYGLPPYDGQEESVVAISKHYGVTRSSIYQREQTALKKLATRLQVKTT